MALFPVSGGLGSRLAVRDSLELRDKLFRHEVNRGEGVEDGFEDGDGVADMHPFGAAQSCFESRVEVFVPPIEQILELAMLDKSLRFAV